jgi:hypothetical protein
LETNISARENLVLLEMKLSLTNKGKRIIGERNKKVKTLKKETMMIYH